MPASTPDPKQSFLRWFLTPEGQRGPLTTLTAWAKANGISERTVRRWKGEEWFVAGVAEASAARVDGSVAPTETVAQPAATQGDEADYQEVKRALVDGARSGNPKYLDLYFKTYGKPFVEEEVAARSTDFSNENLEDLVAKAILALGPELVAQALRLEGWTVEGPA